MRKEKVEIYCDICGHKILNQSSFPCHIRDICFNCCNKLITLWFKQHPTIWKCKICKGTGKVKGERIDSPSCGENRPEYTREPCPKCQL